MRKILTILFVLLSFSGICQSISDNDGNVIFRLSGEFILSGRHGDKLAIFRDNRLYDLKNNLKSYISDSSFYDGLGKRLGYISKVGDIFSCDKIGNVTSVDIYDTKSNRVSSFTMDKRLSVLLFFFIEL